MKYIYEIYLYPCFIFVKNGKDLFFHMQYIEFGFIN